MGQFGTASSVRLRLYLEGRLVEGGLVSVNVLGGVNAPAQAAIELVPTNTIKHILPGTWVHVFATDPWETDVKGDLSDLNLLFEGVVVSRGFKKSSSGRSFTVQCMDASVFWTLAKQFWINLSSSNGNIVDQVIHQTTGGYGQFGSVTKTESFGYMQSSLAVNRDQGEEKFLDTMISVIDDIGNVNPYYNNVRNRMRITDRVLRGPAGYTDKLFSVGLMGEFLEGLAGRTSGQSDLVEVVNELLSAIYHEWSSIPAPPYVDAEILDRDVFGNIRRTVTVEKKRGAKNNKTVELVNYHKVQAKIIGATIFKPHVYTLSPPTCNILFPNMYHDIGFSESFLGETTRISMAPQIPMVDASGLLSMVRMNRPTEIETFIAQTKDPGSNPNKDAAPGDRTPDAKFGDGYGQAPVFHDYDWMTNEERIRGIVYNFINLAPAPSTLTMADQGKKGANNKRKGGIPKYLQNVASYEYFKSKFVSRQTSVSGPYNPRVVPGFPILILDDSASNLNIVAYLASVSHSIDADGSAVTNYELRYPRLVDEVDYNTPKFDNSYKTGGEFAGLPGLELARDEDGNFDFGRLFDNKNQPPIPEWFGPNYRDLTALNEQYRKWFGRDTGVAQILNFRENRNIKVPAIPFGLDTNVVSTSTGRLHPATAADANAMSDLDKKLIESINEQNANIPLEVAVKSLNELFRASRDNRSEYEFAANLTARSFTKIDEAFKFIGAAPVESIHKGLATTAGGVDRAPKAPSYANGGMREFRGVTSPGYGFYSENGKLKSEPASVSTDKKDTSAPAEISAPSSADRMGAAFPLFDTKGHVGAEATDAKVRSALSKDPENRKPSKHPRYDGRPLMHDFEYRIWVQSLANAGYGPDNTKFTTGTSAGDYYYLDKNKAVVGVKTSDQQRQDLEDAQQRRAEVAALVATIAAAGKHPPRQSKCPNMPPKVQAPTGDALDEDTKYPLPQPLSERQVVDLRRAIIDAYVEELEKSSGFTG